MRRAVQDGQTVAVTFHHRVYAYMVPADQWEKAQAALAREQQRDDEEAAMAS
jgi:antitoxin (DNA-binding transcriptional repressor) of toxin-antitoxin stability system